MPATLSPLPTPTDASEQQRHLMVLLAAAAVTALMLLWLGFGASNGYLAWNVLVGAALWGTSSLSVALMLVRTGLNQRLRDPGMITPMVLAAAICVTGVVHHLEPQYRMTALPWLCIAFSFAAFSRRTWPLLKIAACVALIVVAEAAWYLQKQGDHALIAWQLSVTLGSLLCTAAFCGILNDRRAKATKKLSENKTILDSLAEAVVSLNEAGKITELNRAAARLTQTSNEQARGLTIAELLRPATDRDTQALLSCLNTAHESVLDLARTQIDSRMNDDGALIQLECTPAVVHNRKGKAIGQVLVVRDVSDAARMVQKLEYDSNHDELTGLLNRRGFQNALAKTVQSFGDSPAGTRHALLIVDLDQFKIVNDTCGHAAGDSLLMRVAEQLRATIRKDDVVARYGGDEFSVVLHDVTGQTAAQIAESVLRALGTLHFEWGGRRFKTGASIGCAMIEPTDTDTAKIVRKADSALYLAKELGRGRVQMHAEGDEQIAKKSRELEWACRINDALEENEFELHAQKVSCQSSKFEDHYEILVRMLEPNGDLIAPGDFIPAAERFNLMPSIDRWVVRNTLAMLERAGKNKLLTPKVAINLSAQSINDRDFLPFLLDELQHSSVPADRICFELTETVAIANFDIARVFVESIRAMGCTFALDDVGAGFNSFNYLKVLTFDTIKIDGHYIRNYERDPVDRALVESLVHAAASLGLMTVAEMVETDATAQDLKRMGVDQLQGFGIHRPEPLACVLSAINATLEVAS